MTIGEKISQYRTGLNSEYSKGGWFRAKEQDEGSEDEKLLKGDIKRRVEEFLFNSPNVILAEGGPEWLDTSGGRWEISIKYWEESDIMGGNSLLNC